MEAIKKLIGKNKKINKMTTKEKELLLKDLCARLPYGVKLKAYNGSSILTGEHYDILTDIEADNLTALPYLRPMSSMTEEEANYMLYTLINDRDSTKDIKEECKLHALWNSKLMDWLIAGHFDFRGLIEKGLAIDCTNLNIY